MVPNATRVTVRLVVCLSGKVLYQLSHSSCLFKNELGNPYFSLYCMSVVGGGSCRLEVRNNKRATARGSLFYFFVSFGWYMREVVVLPSRLLLLFFFFFGDVS